MKLMKRIILSILFLIIMSKGLNAQTVTSQSACLWSTDTVRIYFDNALDSSAQTTTNYSLNPTLTISSAAIRGISKAVELKFTSSIVNKKKYSIVVMGLTNLSTTRYVETFLGVEPEPMFHDDFNRPNNSLLTTNNPAGKWNSTVFSGDGSLTLSTMAKSGTYGLQAFANTSTGRARLIYNLTSASTFYYKFDFLIPTGYFNDIKTSSWSIISQTMNSAGVRYFRLDLGRNSVANGGNMYLLAYYNIGTTSVYNGILAENRWYTFECMIPSCTATTSLYWWINGIAQPSVPAVDITATVSWSQVLIGFMLNQGQWPHSLYFDNFVISSNPIGIIPTPPIRKRRPIIIGY